MGYLINKKTGLTDAQEKVLETIDKLQAATPSRIRDVLDLSNVMIHRHLKTLLELDQIEKFGSAPKVYYQIKQNKPSPIEFPIAIEKTYKDLIDSFFVYGDYSYCMEGWDGFLQWFQTKQLPSINSQKSRRSTQEIINEAVLKLVKHYCEIRNSIEIKRDSHGLIDATARYHSIFSKPCVDKVYYFDFYSLPQFGKTKLGVYVQKAKVGDKSCREYIKKILDLISVQFKKFTQNEKFDAYVWVPHSIKRQVGLMTEIKKSFPDCIPQIEIMKVFKNETIPQKSLSDLDQRIKNAKMSNHIMTDQDQLKKFKRICIIDDAIGSNATIHGIAEKIRKNGSQAKIFAIAIIGSYKGFDVIRDI